MRRKSTNLHPKLLRLHALPVTVVHNYTYKPSMNYFPSSDQKNSLNGSSSTFSKCKDVWWCERLLLLPWRNLPSPPQGRNRETTDEKERRSQFAYQGQVLFCFTPNTSHLCCDQFQSSQREKARCLPGMWVIYVHLALQGWIMREHVTSLWCVWSILWFTCVMYWLNDAHAC